MTSSISRTRTGCWSCRERRVKCDENRPVCLRCARNGDSCNYGVRLIWHEESLSKGVCHGRAGVWSKRNSKAGKEGRRCLQEAQNLRSGRGNDGNPCDSTHDHNWSKDGQAQPAIFLNTTVDDLRLYFAYDDEAIEKGGYTARTVYRTERPYNESSALVLRPSLRFGPAMFRTTDYDSSLLSYYEAVICSSSTLLDDAQNNPYRYLILPMAMQSQGLYHATLAISANTLRLTDSNYSVVALEHRQRALKILIQILNEGTGSSREIDEALGLVLMLCWFEISDRSSRSWVTHLNGLWHLLSRCRQSSPSFLSTHSEQLDRFFHRYFAFHIVLARTAFRIDDDIQFNNWEGPAYSNSLTTLANQTPSSHCDLSCESPTSHQDTNIPQASLIFSKSTNLLLTHTPLDTLNQIDPYMGFSNSLLLLINEIAELACQNPQPSTPTEPEIDSLRLLQSRVYLLRRDLENLRQTPPPSVDTGEHNSTTDQRFVSELIATAETYRYAALLLLHEIYAPVSRPAGEPASYRPNTGRLPNLPAADREKFVREILRLIVEELSGTIGNATMPLWPLFLAGCCAMGDEERITVLKIFGKSESLKRFGNVAPAREVVELVWRQRDLAVQDDRKRRKAHHRSNANKNEIITGSPSDYLALNAIMNSNADPFSFRAETDPLRPSTKRTKRFEWERAMAMLGGWKLSLT
ncbi:hypothetical protein FQN51_003311 [Onygenales sp. PD_10]|nr:hypothetical protein FQN51_003311 [Onygenales sp. PD_10]